MLLTPQHRRSARIESRMQKTAQQLFNEKIANGTMTKEELFNTPTCLRNFDEAEDAILENENTDDESEDAILENEDVELYRQQQEKNRLLESAHNTRKALFNMEKSVIENRIGKMEEEAEYDLSYERKQELYQEALELKRMLMKLEYQNLIYALELLQLDISTKSERVQVQEKKETPTECVQEDSIASRLLKRRLRNARGEL